jgi:SAM-dependent methyltransferase
LTGDELAEKREGMCAASDARWVAPSESSDEVRAFYESHPYPAPLRDLDRHRELYRNPDRRRAASLLLWPTQKPAQNRRILITGCGTSQAVIHAMREPDAQVTGIDISESSLSHTRGLQQKYDLQNLDLHRLAIEEVGNLGLTFDEIVCTGVLHHLPDPDLGLRSLRAVMAWDGALHVMVYAAYGRAGVYMMQEYCRLVGVRANEEELRALGATIGALPTDHPIAGVARRAKDFRQPDALADALLHPVDRAYTVPQLHAWLQRCGLSFARWREQAPYLPECGFIAGTPHAARLASLPAHLQHAAVELLRGTMTKHDFIAYRDDRASNSQPIAFDGERWLSYVPVRLPWTISVRERLPDGASVVLINRAHVYPDLALALNASQERVLSSIDGIRTVGQILRDSTASASLDQGREFFERLWRYDQIAVDATGAG